MAAAIVLILIMLIFLGWLVFFWNPCPEDINALKVGDLEDLGDLRPTSKVGDLERWKREYRAMRRKEKDRHAQFRHSMARRAEREAQALQDYLDSI